MKKLMPLLCCGLFVAAAAAAAWQVKTIIGPEAAGDTPFDQIFGVVRGPDGCLYFCELGGDVIRKIDADGKVSIVAGGHGKLSQPHEVRFGRDGELYVADTGHHRVCRVNVKTGAITVIAGIGQSGFSGDGGPATSAAFALPISIQFDPAGDLFVCDIGNRRVRRIDHQTGLISTFAGTGERGRTPDGAPYATSPLNGPRSIDFDAAGNGWVVLREGNQLLKLDRAKQTVHLIAGTGKSGYSGDGGPAKLATLSGPKGLVVTPDARLIYLADTESSTIRVIDLAAGSINLVCGAGKKGAKFDADATRCQLARPHALFLEADGSLIVADSYNNRVLALRR